MSLTKEQMRILKTLDVDTALKGVAARGFIPDNRAIALAGLHKARIAMREEFTDEEIRLSKQWLQENGYRTGMFT